MYSPFTEVGRLASEVADLERKLNNKANDYELTNLQNKVRGLGDTIESLTREIYDLQEQIRLLKEK